MSSSPLKRWYPGFVALRWRHLFWALPLLGLLVGGGIQARSVIQRQESAPLSMAGIRDLILSGAVLQEAGLNSGHVKEWTTDSANRLRKIVACEEIKGTSLLAITIKGRSSSTKVDLCNQLPTLAGEKTNELRNQRITEAEAKLEALNQSFKEKRRDYLNNLKTSLGVPEEQFVATPDYLKAKDEFAEAEKALETGRTDYINLRLQGVGQGWPIVIIEKAAAPVAFSMKELVEPLSRVSYWIGASVLLAALLAYFMEWRYPRRVDSGTTIPLPGDSDLSEQTP